MIKLSCGDASKSDADADLVFCHPYATLPPQLIGKPSIINLCGKKKQIAQEWVGTDLWEISKWGRVPNTLYVANLPVEEIDLTDLIEDEIEPGNGFMPLELPLRVLRVYGRSGLTVWDGFMGRGTIGKACQMLGMNYVGIDIDPKRFEIAREYLA